MPLQILYCQKKLLETPTKHFQHHTRAGRGRLSTLARTRQDKTTANSGPLVSQMHCYFLFLAPLLSSKAFHSPNAGGSVPITSAQTRMSNLPFAASSHTSKVDYSGSGKKDPGPGILSETAALADQVAL